MSSPPLIPDHTLLRPIGRGAYGEVWLARNIMGAPRAVKIIWREQFESDRPYEREFAGLQRYEPVSRSADGLVHVLHIGRDDAKGFFYYVMELADPVAGSEFEAANSSSPILRDTAPAKLEPYAPRTLRSDLKRRGSLPTSDCLDLALDIASGLTHLHRQGLVHRDVKPANIIFVEGRAKLADIGLISTGDEARTFVGTEGYIPPEGPGTPGADLYALGLSLYEASTGLPSDRFPDVPPEWLRDDAGDDELELHEVILKCCESDRARRYRNTEELRADVALLQSGQSVRRMRALEKRVCYLRRAALSATLVVVTAVVIAAFANWRAQRAEELQARESQLRSRAESAEQDSRERLHAAFTAQARATVQSLEAGRRSNALAAIRQAAVIRVTPELRQYAFVALSLTDLEIEREIELGPDARGVGFNRDLSRYAVGHGLNTVEIHSVGARDSMQRIIHGTNSDARWIRFSADGRFVAFKQDRQSAFDADLDVWNLASTQRVFTVPRAVSKDALDWHPRKPLLLVGRRDRRLTEWDVERNVESANWPLPSAAVLVGYSPDGGRVALNRPDGITNRVEIRSATNGSLLSDLPMRTTVRALAWHPAGLLLAIGSDDGIVRLWNTLDGSSQIVGEHNAQVTGAAFAWGGEFLVTRGWDTTVNFWNVGRYRREMTFKVSASLLQATDDGARLVVSSPSQARIFRFNRAPECRELEIDFPLTARKVAFSRDGRWLCIDGNEGVGIWDLRQPGPGQWLTAADLFLMGFTSDSAQLFAVRGNKLAGWKLEDRLGTSTARAVWTSLPTNAFPNLIRSPSGLGSLSWSNLNQVHPPISTMQSSAGLSPDGRWIARRASIAYVLVVERQTDGQNEIRITNSARVRSQAFSPDNRSLAVLTEDELKILDTSTWKPRVSRAAEGKVFAHLAFSPDGRTLLCVENTQTAALLNAATLEPIFPMPAWCHPMAISPDGRWLVMRVEGRRAQLWDLVALRARFRALGIDWEDPNPILGEGASR